MEHKTVHGIGGEVHYWISRVIHRTNASISSIDLSALEMLEDLNLELAKLNICLNLSEIKGPVMDKLQNSKLLAHLKGRVFLTHYEATQVLSKDVNIE